MPSVTACIGQRVYIEKHFFSLKATAPSSRLFVTWHLIVVVSIFFFTVFTQFTEKNVFMAHQPDDLPDVHFLYK